MSRVVGVRKETLWEAQCKENPGHSRSYIERFESLRAEGADLDGEARLIDAMLPRGSKILDAGCGPGRVGGELGRRGHQVVGVDADPVLLAAAKAAFPEQDWRVGDLSESTLSAEEATFDLVVCAGNVMAFLAPGTAPAVLQGFHSLLVDGGRAVIGCGTDRGYDPEVFQSDALAAGFTVDGLFSSWDLRPYPGDTNFVVAVLGRAASAA